MRNKALLFCAMCILVSISVIGCGKKSQDKVLATVNGEPIRAAEFNRSLAMNFKRDPSFSLTPETLENQVNMLIDRRLLIQEARKRELDQTDRFISTIKTFWEQTLIRDLMAEKDRQMKESVFASKDEIINFYDKLASKKTFKVFKSTDKVLVLEFFRANPASVEWQEKIGPIGYDEISSDLLREAFVIPRGQMKVFKNDGSYYIFYVSDEKKVSISPLADIREDIKKKIINAKKQKMFDAWLKEVRGESEIKMNENVLKGISHDKK